MLDGCEKVRGSKQAVISVLRDDIEPPVPFNVSQSVRLTLWSRGRSHASFGDLIAGIREKLTRSRPPPGIRSSRPRKSALVVGVGAIDSDAGALPAAESMARAVVQFLREAGGGEVSCRARMRPCTRRLRRANRRRGQASDVSARPRPHCGSTSIVRGERARR